MCACIDCTISLKCLMMNICLQKLITHLVESAVCACKHNGIVYSQIANYTLTLQY